MIGGLFFTIPSAFIPQEDEGVIFANVVLKETASINQTAKILSELGEQALKTAGVRFFIGISGASLLGSTSNSAAS